MDSSTRQMTATTGRTVLAIVAILSLLLSAFAIARPVIAAHDDGTPEVTGTRDESREEGGGNIKSCLDGATLVRFESAQASDSRSGSIDGIPYTIEYTITDGKLTFVATGALVAEALIKGGSATTIYDYSGFPGGGIAHDDGLFATEGGISNVGFCLIPIEASILVYKTDQTDANVAGAEFSVFDGETKVAGPAATNADGVVCFDGLVLDKNYTVVETSVPDGYIGAASQSVAASLGNCEDRITAGDAADATFTNTLLGSLLVLKVDDGDPISALPDAEFSITGPAGFSDTAISDADGWFCIDGLTYGEEYTVTETKAPDGYEMGANNPQSHMIDDSATCAERVADSPAADLIFVNVRDQEEPTGSITINKEFDECVACEAFTPGYWFNRGGGGGVSWANDWLATNPQAIAGVGTFASVGDVQAYLDWDISGGDGANGLSATGQLLRHYLALVLNVAFAEANDCNLLDLVYGDADIATWLQRASDALTGDASDADKGDIKDALDAINNSDAGDGTLECPSEGTDGSAIGFTFTLWQGGVPVGEKTVTEGNSVKFDELALGTYVITETAPDGFECTIVSAWLGDTPLDVVNGEITVTITTDNLDLVITVVNDCEQPGEEDEYGDVVIIKDAADDTDEPFGFSASWTGGGADFDLTDGQAWPSGDVLAGTVITVTEELTPEQMLAGWSLEDIDCGDADVTVEGYAVTITVAANATITCTFTNELEEQPDNGLVEIDKVFCFTDGEASTTFEVFDPILIPTGSELFGQAEEPGAGCWTEAVSFTISGGDLEADLKWTTNDNGSLEEVLPASVNPYTITEDLTGESAEFYVEDGHLTVIMVLNLVEEEDAGLVKVIKLFCETANAADAGVTFMVEGGNAPVPVISGCTRGDATFMLGDLEIATEGGIALELVDVGSYTFAETDPNVAEYDGMIEVEDGEITTIIVFNTFVEGEQGGNPGPGQSETPREGTAGGNPLPNTATTPAPGGSLPAILLALMALGALSVGGYRMATEARSRR